MSLYGSYDRYGDSAPESTLGINISIPFSTGNHFTNVALVSDLASRNKNTHGLNINGSALDDYSLRYDVTAEHSEHRNDALKSSIGYQYNSGELNISMTRSGTQRDYHGDVSGSVLVYQEGVVMGQTLGSTAALVQVPGSAKIGFYNQFGFNHQRKWRSAGELPHALARKPHHGGQLQPARRNRYGCE
ncbi:outer membrane usher protein [Enterobacter cancerogenus]|uniref:Outer membrane usher protein n=1 Tax=Enterobacter cancerogenus TaxID=69218 RepID=A0A484Y6U9_9ENTR|nr:outer membrane usher protein [Enterobacter cancerogenus]